jgi:hypothetical protein
VWPEAAALSSALRRVRRQLALAAVAHAVLMAAALTGVLLVALSWSSVSIELVPWMTGVTFVLTVGAAAITNWRAVTLRRAAMRVEAHRERPDNAVIAAEEIVSGRARRPHRVIQEHLFAAAIRGLDEAPPQAVQPLGRLTLLAAGAVVALVALELSVLTSRCEGDACAGDRVIRADAAAAVALVPGDLRVVITPPPYTGEQPSIVVNPSIVLALEGSRVRLEASRALRRLVLLDVDATTTPFRADGEVLFTEFVAIVSRPLVIRPEGGTGADRLLTLRVRPDDRPAVRIERPAKDLAFPHPSGHVPIAIDARDDVRLRDVVLRYTRVSGAGETFTFQEGEWPLAITRSDAQHWTARGSFALDQLELQDGDTLVYRAVATDAKPGADPVASDTFLIEIGRLAGAASTGFALPEDRERQALSQQMLIIKTERLHATRPGMAADAFLEQARLLAIEQRLVKAEFVFMTGGEVEDEVEEAAGAHELAEGRLENTAQVELLAAIREMSRAEARLNDANTVEALQFERAALRALQRAFDRRRYLLRTLPERTRIDLSRRLTGEIGNARSSKDPLDAPRVDSTILAIRSLIADLGAADAAATNGAILASRIVAIDPRSEDLQKAALQLSSARDSSARVRAATEAQGALIELLKARLGRPRYNGVARDVLAGRVIDELSGRPPR